MTNGWLKTTEVYSFLAGSRGRSLRSRCQQGQFVSGDWGGLCSVPLLLLPVASGDCWQFLAFLALRMCDHNLCLHPHMPIPSVHQGPRAFSYKDTCHWLGTTQIQDDLISKPLINYMCLIRSHSQVWGLRLASIFWAYTIQPITIGIHFFKVMNSSSFM
jgi:hypothetical protein